MRSAHIPRSSSIEVGGGVRLHQRLAANQVEPTRKYSKGRRSKSRGVNNGSKIPLRSRSNSMDPVGNVQQKTRLKQKQAQTKKANDRLARLEKMYQELTEIEIGTSKTMI